MLSHSWPITLSISLTAPQAGDWSPTSLHARKLRFAGAEELAAFQRQEVVEWRLSELLFLTPKPRLLASLSKGKVLVSKKE